MTDSSNPYDPAGTRPKVDPETLQPKRAELSDSTGLSSSASALPVPLGPAEAPAVVPPAEPPVPSESPRPIGRTPHAPRFQFMFGALGAVAVAALALAVVIANQPAKEPSAPWSAWSPSSEDGDPAPQIAEHVEPQYALSANRPLVGVTGGPQAIGGQPVVVALRTSGSKPEALPEEGVFYQLCGEGANCSIPGKPSLKRGLLVRREALELALYTFKYVKGASQVIVTYPPLPSSSTKSSKGGEQAQSTTSTSDLPAGTTVSSASGAPSRVLLFRPESLQAELSQPLQDTLTELAPTIGTVEKSPEAALVNSLTENVLYDSSLINEQQASTQVLLLQQPSIGG